MGSFKKHKWNQFGVNKADEATAILGHKARLQGNLHV
jgi:hypothetical protein